MTKIRLKIPKRRNKFVVPALNRKAGAHKNRKRESKHTHFKPQELL